MRFEDHGRSQRLSGALRALTVRTVPGLSAAVVVGDRIVEDQAAGVADLASHSPVDSNTVFLWFSMTKIVTATAVMQLAERGELRLDDPVRTYVPQFPERRAGWPQVTIRHLLSHSSGLGNPIPVRWVHLADQPARDPHEFTLDLLERHGRLRCPAGQQARYSNLGYLVLGEVISAAAGARYEDYVRGEILLPLGMTRTDFGYRPDMAETAATGYHRRLSPTTPVLRAILPKGIIAENQGRFLGFHRFCVDGPAYGGLVGSTHDAARFLRVHLSDGSGGETSLITPASVQAMQTIHARGRKLSVGLGWFRRNRDPRTPHPHLEHLGGGGGFFNMMRIYPEARIGIAAMGNATSYDHQRIAAAIAPR